jgi:hypothetical protein
MEQPEKDADVSHVEAVAGSNNDPIEDKVIITLAKDASEFEHQLTALQAIRAYPMAIFWSLMVSMCVVMEGKFLAIESLHLLRLFCFALLCFVFALPFPESSHRTSLIQSFTTHPFALLRCVSKAIYTRDS